jgi:hypothetical protein
MAAEEIPVTGYASRLLIELKLRKALWLSTLRNRWDLISGADNPLT